MSARWMKSGVGSIGSPIPKSINSTPLARAAAFASSSRTNGYVFSEVRTGERVVTASPYR